MMSAMRGGLRRWWTAAAVAVAATVLAGCDLLPIPGEGPLRYRDEIFSEVARTENVHYATAENQQGQLVDLLLDVYEPVGDTVDGRPLVVFVHGGSFRAGNKGSLEIVDQANALAKKGYVVASINYRLSQGGCTGVTLECIISIRQAREDATAAIKFLRAHADEYGIDTDRVAIAGTSAGAITALGVAYAVEDAGAEVRAAVSFSGALIPFLDDRTVDRDDPQSLLFHGTADALVPYAWAEATNQQGMQAGVPVYLVTWQGEGHVPYVPHRDQIIDLTTNFLYRRLDLANAEQ